MHASGAFVPGLYLLDQHVLQSGIVTWRLVQALAVGGLIVTAILEAARLYAGFDHVIYQRLTREYEQEKVAGYALYVLSSTIVVLVFDPQIAVPALLMLMLGDPVSGILAGDELRLIKRPRVLVGMFVVCLALAYPFVSPLAAILGALGAMVADGVKLTVGDYIVDDNLTIPILSAVVMRAVLAV
ncbi:dolichol kinase [Natronomonas sp.]|uniref:dolichol kinase n=1 Tax=Natronomonas sp. TaxID=2184060 RepID=UPI0039E33059